MKFRNPFAELERKELALWLISAAAVTVSFFFGGHGGAVSLAASLVGVTALIFVARGDVFGQILSVVFSLLYGYISMTFRYYGEMITYLGMTAPIAAATVVSWLKHPYESGKAEVEIAELSTVKKAVMVFLTAAVTFVFYFILRFFGTANLAVSTVSIATSFMACYLMLFRSPFYAIAYAANDIVLIILWTMASLENIGYLPMVVCFAAFFANDMYGFINWRRMKMKQSVGRQREEH